MAKYKKVKFKGKEYFLIGKEAPIALATKNQYENGKVSFAALNSDGDIKRYGNVIGKKEDLEPIGEEELERRK